MIRFGLKTSIACLLVGAIAGASVAIAAQPHMVNALGSLQAARAEMFRAEANKGGHRDRAIEQTKAGIAYAGN